MTTKLALASFVGAAAVAAAAAGGYVALRSNAHTAAKVEAVQPAEPAPAAVDTTSGAVVDDHATTPAKPASEPLAAPPSARSSSGNPSSGNTATPAPVVVPKSKSASSKAPAATQSSAAPVAAPSPLPVYAPEPAASDSRDNKFEAPPPAPAEPPKPRFLDVTVKEDSVIGIRLDSSVTTATAKVEDKVSAHVVRDVVIDGRTAIPSNAKLEGVVAVVEHGGKFKDRARLGIRFQSLVLADGTRVPVQTDMIFREGDSPTGAATSKVGASAVVGTILGAAIGGKKGAAIGATVGAAGGTAAVMASDDKEAVLAAGTPLTVRLTGPVTVSVERNEDR